MAIFILVSIMGNLHFQSTIFPKLHNWSLWFIVTTSNGPFILLLTKCQIQYHPKHNTPQPMYNPQPTNPVQYQTNTTPRVNAGQTQPSPLFIFSLTTITSLISRSMSPPPLQSLTKHSTTPHLHPYLPPASFNAHQTH